MEEMPGERSEIEQKGILGCAKVAAKAKRFSPTASYIIDSGGFSCWEYTYQSSPKAKYIFKKENEGVFCIFSFAG